MKFTIKGTEDITVKDLIALESGPIAFVAAMTKQTIEQVRNIPANVFETLKKECEAQFALVTPKDPRKIKIGDTTFSIVPDFMAFEAGAVIDISEADEIDKTKYLTTVLSALFRPEVSRVGGRYEVEQYTAKQRPELLDLPLQYYRGAEVFFSGINAKLMKTSLNSLSDQVAKMKRELSK